MPHRSRDFGSQILQGPVVYRLDLNLERKKLRIGAIFAVAVCVQRSGAPCEVTHRTRRSIDTEFMYGEGNNGVLWITGERYGNTFGKVSDKNKGGEFNTANEGEGEK
jgi:hypothetical protein